MDVWMETNLSLSFQMGCYGHVNAPLGGYLLCITNENNMAANAKTSFCLFFPGFVDCIVQAAAGIQLIVKCS